MTQTTFTDNVVIDGSQNITQLTVEGHSTQDEALQTWQDGAQTPLAKVTGDGRLQVGDFEPAGTMATDDALIEAHRSDTSTKPKRGLHTLGRIGGVVSDAITWAVQELELLGGGGVSSLQTALRARLTHKNTGSSTTAELRAGDFETTNETGTTGARVGKAIGARAAVRNLTDAFLEEAIGSEIFVENAGTITDVYGLKIEDMPSGVSGSRYALYSGIGTAHFGDDLEVPILASTPAANPPANFAKLYTKLVSGEPHLYTKDAAGTERELSVGGGPATNTFTARNVTGNTITKGTPVYAVGGGSGLLSIALSDASIGATQYYIGLADENIAASSDGEVRTSGALVGIDTSAWAAGTNLYIAVGGGLTSTSPTGQNYRQIVATVLVQDASDGAIFVYPFQFKPEALGTPPEQYIGPNEFLVGYYYSSGAAKRFGRNALWTTASYQATNFSTGNINNLLVGGFPHILLRMSNSSDATITGLVGSGISGQMVTIVSEGAGNVYLAHQNTGSTDTNRLINTVTSVPTPLAAGKGYATYVYDHPLIGSGRWRLVNHEQGGFIPYSPSWTVTSGSAPSVGNGSLTGAYLIDGTDVEIFIRLVAGSTTTFGTGGSWRFSLPFSLASATPFAVMSVDIRNTGVTLYPSFGLIADASTVLAYSVTGTPGQTNNNIPFAWGDTDEYRWSGRIRIA